MPRVEVWGGVFNDPQGGWVPAPASLLWPGTRVYLQAAPADGAGDGTLDATRVRIVGEPSAERVKQVDIAEVRDSVAADSAVALLGSQAQPGLYLLNGDRKAQQLWQYENSAAWVNGDPNAGFILREPQAAGGLSTFTWVRNDGTGLQFFAQPYHTVQGVAGDAYGGLWWIETPQATMDQWQLWHYDPATATVALRLQATGKLFTANDESTRRTPILRAVQPVIPGDVSNVILYVDTVDTERQTPYAGFYRLAVQTDGSGTAKVSDGPKLLLGEGQYRGPLLVSPDLTRLAYFAYDPAVPSLTSGAVKPANRLNLLTLPGRGESAAQPVYKTETRFEFLSPDVAWLGNDRLLAARSRFAAGGTDLDQFGIVQVQLPPPDAPADGAANGTGNSAIAANSYLLPRQQSLVDFAACLDGTALLLTRDQDGRPGAGAVAGQRPELPAVWPALAARPHPAVLADSWAAGRRTRVGWRRRRATDCPGPAERAHLLCQLARPGAGIGRPAGHHLPDHLVAAADAALAPRRVGHLFAGFRPRLCQHLPI